MHTIKLKVKDSIYEHLIFFLKSLNQNDLEIIEEIKLKNKQPGQAEDILALLKTKRYAKRPKAELSDVEHQISNLRNDWDSE